MVWTVFNFLNRLGVTHYRDRQMTVKYWQVWSQLEVEAIVPSALIGVKWLPQLQQLFISFVEMSAVQSTWQCMDSQAANTVNIGQG